VKLSLETVSFSRVKCQEPRARAETARTTGLLIYYVSSITLYPHRGYGVYRRDPRPSLTDRAGPAATARRPTGCPSGACGTVKRKKNGSRLPKSAASALLGSWPEEGVPTGDHVQSMGRARCARGYEVPRYIQNGPGMPRIMPRRPLSLESQAWLSARSVAPYHSPRTPRRYGDEPTLATCPARLNSKIEPLAAVAPRPPARNTMAGLCARAPTMSR